MEYNPPNSKITKLPMPPKATPRKIKQRAAELRHNQTPAETILWIYLRRHRLDGIHFRRQHPIANYIVDFCAPRQRLVIELDGSQHLDQQEYDAKRTADLAALGYRVLRFWNNEVNHDIQGVILAIEQALEESK